jgi:hypothetical protein
MAKIDDYLVLHDSEHNSTHGPTRCLGKNGFVAKLARLAVPFLRHFGRYYGPPASSEGSALRNLSLA